jgi:glucose/arabinose dehydrogenase
MAGSAATTVRRVAVPLATAVLALAACSDADPGRAATPPPLTASGSPAGPPTGSSSQPTVTAAGDVTTGLEVPWGLAFLPGGSALVSERMTGRILRVQPDGVRHVLGTVPGVVAEGEGGLLGLAVPPGGSTAVYAYLTTDRDNRVVRLPLTGSGLGTPEPVLTDIPKGRIHNGGRIVFGPDGDLWVGTGETGNPDLAQDTGSLAGKILRVRPDGTVPSDNPFPGSAVWSYGHRNVQGLAFDSAGRLWASEFGASAFDELNLVERGGNHGWPVVEGVGGDAGFVDPQVTWPTADASPSGLVIVGDVAYLAALRGQRLWQVPLVDGRARTPKGWLDGRFGRLRTLAAAPDGSLWLTTSNRDGRGTPRAGDDRIVRLELSG